MPTLTLTRDDMNKMAAIGKDEGLKTFFLAKDQGAYIGIVGKKEKHIVYFRGMNPEKDEYWYEAAADAFGGDDFGEWFDLPMLTELLKDETVSGCKFNVGKTKISIKSVHNRKPQPKIEEPTMKELSDILAAPKTETETIGSQTEEKPKKIGAYVRECIAEGMDNDTILASVKALFPNAKTSKASISWYRSQMKKGK